MMDVTAPFGAGLGPVGQSVLIPAIAALAVAGLVRLLGGKARAALAVALGLGAAQVAIAWAIGGMPKLVAPAAVDKLVLTTLAFGPLAAGMVRRGRLEPRAIAPIAALAPVIWIAWPLLVSLDPATLPRLALAILAAVAVAHGVGRAEGRGLPLLVALLAVGLAGVALFGATYRMAQLFSGLAVGALAAPLAVLLAGGAAGGIGAAVIGAPFRAAAIAGLASGAAILLLFTVGPPLAMALLLPAVLAGQLAPLLPGGRRTGSATATLMTLSLAALSVVGAVLLAWTTSEPLYLG